MISRISNYFMFSFHQDITWLVHSLSMETPIENSNLVSLEECLESISLKFSHLDSGKDNIFSYNQANGDTFKALFLTIKSWKSLECVHNSGWVDDLIFTSLQLFSIFPKNLIFRVESVIPNLLWYLLARKKIFQEWILISVQIHSLILITSFKTKMNIMMIQKKKWLSGMTL